MRNTLGTSRNISHKCINVKQLKYLLICVEANEGKSAQSRVYANFISCYGRSSPSRKCIVQAGEWLIIT